MFLRFLTLFNGKGICSVLYTALLPLYKKNDFKLNTVDFTYIIHIIKGKLNLKLCQLILL